MVYTAKVNKRNDYAFKRIFGHEDTKDILARFLTVIKEQINSLGRSDGAD